MNMRSNTIHTATSALLCLSAVGCADEAVHSGAGQSHADSPLEWRISNAPEVRIGAVDSDDSAVLFSSVRALTRLSDGRIVVLDQKTNEVRWFSATGDHLLTVGGSGKGPGEFTSATTIFRMPGDSIVVADAPLIKHAIYAPDGTLAREERLDYGSYRAHGRWLECLTATLPDRSLLGCQEEPGLQAGVTNRPGHLRTFSRYYLAPWSMDTVYKLGLHGGIEQWGVENGRGRISYVVHPLYARTVVGIGSDPAQVAIAINPEYAIEVWQSDGTLARTLRRPDARYPASSEQLEAAKERMKFFAFGDEALFNKMLAEMKVPDSIPAVGSLVFGPDGELWVGRTRPDVDDRRYDVFSGTGEFLGEVVAPPSLYLREVGRDYVLGVRIDDDGVNYVELYSLVRDVQRVEDGEPQ